MWSGASVAALAIPPDGARRICWRRPWCSRAAGLVFGLRVNALAEAAAPAAARGRYLAAFQYSFTVPGVMAPAVVALFSVAVWLPWLVVAAAAGLAIAALRWLARRLPAGVLWPEPARPSGEATPPAAAA